MSVLDELRKMVETTAQEKADDARSAWMLVVDWLKLLDAFEAAHPGLTDLTLICRHCGNPWHGGGDNLSAYDEWERTGRCPACAKAGKVKR